MDGTAGLGSQILGWMFKTLSILTTISAGQGQDKDHVICRYLPTLAKFYHCRYQCFRKLSTVQTSLQQHFISVQVHQQVCCRFQRQLEHFNVDSYLFCLSFSLLHSTLCMKLLKHSAAFMCLSNQLKGKKAAATNGVASKQKTELKNQSKKNGVSGTNGTASLKRNNSSK